MVGVVSVNEELLTTASNIYSSKIVFRFLTTPSITIAADPNGLLHG
jgi:hypothetical protein